MLENILIEDYTEDSSPLDPPFITTCINMVTHVYRTEVVQLSKHGIIQFSSVQFSSVTQLYPTLCNLMDCSTPALPVHHQSLPKLMFIESVMPSNHLILCRPLLLLPSIFPSIRVFSSESVLCIRWPKYWSFSFNISPSNE